MRSCPRCALANPDSALVCDCGYALQAETSPANPVWPRHRITDLRGRGVIALLLGLACLYLAHSELRRAERHEQKEIHYSVRLTAFTPALLLLGVALTVFPRRAATALDRRAGTKPVVWLVAIALAAISVGFAIWMERKFAEYGYVHRRPELIRPAQPKYEGL